MSISFVGIPSVLSRTVWTQNGPIVKSGRVLSSGLNLQIIDPTVVELPSVFLNNSYIGKYIRIAGSPDQRNDGEFKISEILSPRRCRLENSNFYVVNDTVTFSRLLIGTKNLYFMVRDHIPSSGPHLLQDDFNAVTIPEPLDLPGVIYTLNILKSSLNGHITIYDPFNESVHRAFDNLDLISNADAYNLSSAVILFNEILTKYSNHCLDQNVHYRSDSEHRISGGLVVISYSDNSYNGPFYYDIKEYLNGVPANAADDVKVTINGVETNAELVDGLIGAVVLDSVPNITDSIQLSYSYTKGLPWAGFILNDFGSLFNSVGNRAISGFPSHTYRASTSLVIPSKLNQAGNPVKSYIFGYKYKAFDKLYTASLNDASSLLLNAPLNKLNYSYDLDKTRAINVAWDARFLPTSTTDPWTQGGGGLFNLNINEYYLYLYDSVKTQGLTSIGPYYYKSVDFGSNSLSSISVRCAVNSYSLNGNSTQVGFGFTDGYRLCLLQFLEGPADNISSALGILNDLLNEYNRHCLFDRVHEPKDVINIVNLNPAYDLESAIAISKILKRNYNRHLDLGPLNVHRSIDAENKITNPDPTDLDGLLLLLNEILEKFNKHVVVGGVHFNPNPEVIVSKSKQIGVLLKSANSIDMTSYRSYSHDWTKESTYRIFRSGDGSIRVYLSGITSPVIEVTSDELPLPSFAEFAINDGQVVFWGSLGSGSSSESKWKFVNVNVNPVYGLVKYAPVRLSTNFDKYPRSADPPWIDVGYGGVEFLNSGMTLDSSSKASNQNVQDIGYLNGAYKGNIRVEPFLGTDTTIDVSFSTYGIYHTHSLDNSAYSVVIEDNDSKINVCFIQPNPVPAVVNGTVAEPFNIVPNDSLEIIINDLDRYSITIGQFITNSLDLANRINEILNLGYLVAYDNLGKLSLTNAYAGSTSSITVLGGTIAQKTGMNPGRYVGRDSTPEPSISYFGYNFPDLEPTPWFTAGVKTVSLIDRKLHIYKTRGEYTAYYQNLASNIGNIILPADDYKLDFRVEILDVIQGDVINSGPNYKYGGICISVNEGSGGKNFELYYVLDDNADYRWAVYSLNPFTGNVDYVASSPAGWDDQSITIITQKYANTIGIQINTVNAISINYNSLNVGYVKPSVSFGSGAKALNNAPLTSSSSHSVWSYFSLFKDSFVNPASASGAAARRAVALYKGGDPSLLKNYEYYNIDWKVPHVYRVIKDPSSGVSVFIDGSAVPAISSDLTKYESENIILNNLESISNGYPYIAYGHLNPYQINRSKWVSLNYSISKLLQDGGITFNRPALNTANTITSNEHLKSGLYHAHSKGSLSSVESPYSNFQFSESVDPNEVYKDLQVPWARTWNDPDAFNASKTYTNINNITSQDMSLYRGTIGSFIIDSVNYIDVSRFTDVYGYADLSDTLVSYTSTLINNYLIHLTSTDAHIIADTVNNGITPPVDYTTCVYALQDLSYYFNSHLIESGVHYNNDYIDTLLPMTISDLSSAVEVYNTIARCFNSHIDGGLFHLINDNVNIPDPLPPVMDWVDIIPIIENLNSVLNSHIVNRDFHLRPDQNPLQSPLVYNLSVYPPVYDTGRILYFLNQLTTNFNQHTSGNRSLSHLTADSLNSVPVTAADLNSAYLACVSLKNAFDQHRTTETNSTSGKKYHAVSMNSIMVPSNLDPRIGFKLQELISVLTSHMQSHFRYTPSHKSIFPNVEVPFLSEYDGYSTSYSAEFDGDGDYLLRDFSSREDDMYLRGATYTIEMWVKPKSVSGLSVFYSVTAILTDSFGVTAIGMNNGIPYFVIRSNTGGPEILLSGGTLTQNQWAHVAFSADNGIGHLFVDGVEVDSGPIPTAQFNPKGACIGRLANNFQVVVLDYAGAISNLRIVQGKALYLSSFIPSSVPLTSVDGTGLLICQNRTLTDSSPNGFTLISVNNVSVSTMSPFSATPEPSRLCVIMNNWKDYFNSHISSGSVHLNGDTFNAITSPDAFDWDSLRSLAMEAMTKFNSHLLQSGVHPGVVLVKDEADHHIFRSLQDQKLPAGDINRWSTFGDELAD